MAYRKLEPSPLAILFCLAVVREHWKGEVPSLGEAARELGVCRALASRLRRRFWPVLLGLIARTHRPGLKAPAPPAEETQRRVAVLEALLGLARAMIAAAGIASLQPARREEIVLAVLRLHAEHGVGYEEAASSLGLCARTLRRLRCEYQAGAPLQPKSRAPLQPHGKLPAELARAIEVNASLFPAVPLAELHRLFVKQKQALCCQHGHPALSYGAYCRSSGRTPAGAAAPRPPPVRGRDTPEHLPYRSLALMDTSDLACFGFDFKLIPFMEAHSRSIFAHQLCEQENAAEVSRVLVAGATRADGVLALRVDRGTPYLAALTVRKVEESGAEMRVARAYTATDKAVLERFFRTAKDALRQILGCVDLSKAPPGEPSWRKQLARTLGSAVVAFFLRYCYPYIPQPGIDGRTPEERTHDRPPASEDVIRAALDERARHHEHAKTCAREIHAQYGFRWAPSRWLEAVRSFTAEDLREAARRFDRILLRACFTCDSRRNPLYLLAILRTVAEQRRAQAEPRRREKLWRAQQAADRQEVESQERQRKECPEAAVAKAIELAKIAAANRGFGLRHAQRWLDQALATIAQRGPDAYQLAAERFLAQTPDEKVRAWLSMRIDAFRPRRNR